MTSEHDEQAKILTNMMTFEALADKFGSEEALHRLTVLGANPATTEAVYERYIANHIHEKWAAETRLYRRSHEDIV